MRSELTSREQEITVKELKEEKHKLKKKKKPLPKPPFNAFALPHYKYRNNDLSFHSGTFRIGDMSSFLAAFGRNPVRREIMRKEGGEVYIFLYFAWLPKTLVRLLIKGSLQSHRPQFSLSAWMEKWFWALNWSVSVGEKPRYFIQLPNISLTLQLARCTRDERYEQTSPLCLHAAEASESQWEVLLSLCINCLAYPAYKTQISDWDFWDSLT